MEKSIFGAIISDPASVNNHRRSFIKDLPMKDVKDRDAQFLNIADIREKAAGVKLRNPEFLHRVSVIYRWSI